DAGRARGAAPGAGRATPAPGGHCRRGQGIEQGRGAALPAAAGGRPLARRCHGQHLLQGGRQASRCQPGRGRSSRPRPERPAAGDTAGEGQREGAGKLELPVDAVCARAVEPGQDTIVRPVDAVDDGWMMLDAGPATVRRFSARLHGAGTVVWNGPVGVFEVPEVSEGTRAGGEAVAASGAYLLVGGGDPAAAVEALGLAGRFSHVSTGGGATLEYMEGRELPGVAVLRDRC